MIFKDIDAGFHQTNFEGTSGLDSEFSILRCEFYRCIEAGVRIMNAEAYNHWVRQCYFEDCEYGIINGPSGAFNAYDNVFVRSVNYDIYSKFMRICGIRRNHSFGSKRFFYVECSNIIVKGNAVSDTTETDAVQLKKRFKTLIVNNKFKSQAEATGPVINELTNQFVEEDGPLAPFAPLFVLSNQFTLADPIFTLPKTPTSCDIQGNLVNPSLTIDMPELPPHPPQVVRPTFLINSFAEDPQATVDAAATHAIANPGSNPVVYVPRWPSGSSIGIARLDKTLVFPVNVRMSLQGGGSRTFLRWIDETRATEQEPYVLFRGPSKVSVMNMGIGLSYNEGGKVGITAVFDNCDQVGGRVYADNCHGTWHFSGLANLKADLCDHVTDPSNQENLPFLVSGPTEASGDGRVLLEGGAGSDSAGNEPMLRVENGGRYYQRDFWYETPNTDKVYAELGGAGGQPGRLSIETSLIEQHHSPWSMKAIVATDWWGDVLYLNDLIVGATTLEGDGSRVNYMSLGGGSPLLADSAAPASMYRQDGIPWTIDQFPTLALTRESFTDNSGWGVFGTKPADWQARLWDTVDRAPAVWLNPLGDGLTDVRLHRATGDITFMSGTYVLPPVTETISFMSAALPADATFTRTTGGTMFNAAPDLVFGLENLVAASQDFSDAAWIAAANGTGSVPVVTPNAAVAPDGTMTASKLVFDSGAGTTIDDWSLVSTTPFGPVLWNDRLSVRVWYKSASGAQIQLVGIFPGSTWPVTCNGEWQTLPIYDVTGGTVMAPIRFGIQQAIDGTRDSTATVWLWGAQASRTSGIRQYVPTSGTPRFLLRFQHNAVNGALLGALAEPASSNTVAYSDERAYWTAVNATFGTGPRAPDNQANSVQITADAGTADHYGGTTAMGVGAGAVVGHSAFVQRGNTRYVVLFDDSDAVWHGATFDFDAESWVGTGTNVTLLLPQKMTDGWWRLGWTSAMTNDVGAVRVAPTPSDTGTAADISYNAAGTEYVYATGLQFESPSVGVTSYIRTLGATVSRGADVLKILRANGTYDVAIHRQDGVELLANQAISDGTFTLPTSTSPVIKVTTTRK
ncbi:MAG: hypothetical protein GEV13_26700 [Rhodospirillales bacterium]|nr:hypothetical protein [Rhodospirillales bacterium]